MNWSYLWAFLIAAAIAGWIASGQYTEDGNAEAAIGPEAEARPQEVPLINVRVIDSVAVSHARTIILRGRTEAERKVAVRAETAGRVTARPINRGDIVEKDRLLCQLSLDDRQAWLAEAQAALRQQEIEFNAADTLVKKGYRSKANAAGSRAALDAAHAGVERMKVEVARTAVRSPFAGIVDTTDAEIGDYLSIGAVCASIVDLDPILVIGFISERELDLINVGDTAGAVLAAGGNVTGTVQFISTIADPATRTFRVELTVPNPGNRFRDGVTAQMALKAAKQPAHLVSPAVLTLGGDGHLGVRVIDDGNVVRFRPVSVLEDTPSGTWIGGLGLNEKIIVVGQEYVVDGEKVAVTMSAEGKG